jgi:hypothetical protein
MPGDTNTVPGGAGIPAGYRPDRIRQPARKMPAPGGRRHNPFGDGAAGRQIIDLPAGVKPA